MPKLHPTHRCNCLPPIYSCSTVVFRTTLWETTLLLHLLPLTTLPTHSVGTSGSCSAAPLPFVCWRLLPVLAPPPCAAASCCPPTHSPPPLAVPSPLGSVGCCISKRLSLFLLSRLQPAPQPPPFITPQLFVAPLSFDWLSHCPAPQPPSRCNSAWCLGLRLLLIPCS